MNYMKILARLDAKLLRYDDYLEKLKDKPLGQRYCLKQIDRIEMIYSKVGRKALKQFNQ